VDASDVIHCKLKFDDYINEAHLKSNSHFESLKKNEDFKQYLLNNVAANADITMQKKKQKIAEQDAEPNLKT
jgi:hypothetical protein